MTVSTAPAPLSYAGDGTTTGFAITWKYFAKAHVVVTLRSSTGTETTWVLDTDYTLTPAGVSTGGTLTATTAPAASETLVIELEPPNTQDTDLPIGGPFPSTSVEDELDEAAQRDAKLEALLDRAMLVPRTDTRTGTNLTIPIDTDRASKFLGFDASGDPVVSAGTSADLTPVSAYINTLLDDADSATARATLEIETSETATGTVTLDADLHTSLIDSSGGAVTATLGSRTTPGFKAISMSDATTSSTVSVANSGVLGSTVVHTLNTIDETLILFWTGRIWITVIG